MRVATGGSGLELCSGDMLLLEALVAARLRRVGDPAARVVRQIETARRLDQQVIAIALTHHSGAAFRPVRISLQAARRT